MHKQVIAGTFSKGKHSICHSAVQSVGIFRLRCGGHDKINYYCRAVWRRSKEMPDQFIPNSVASGTGINHRRRGHLAV